MTLLPELMPFNHLLAEDSRAHLTFAPRRGTLTESQIKDQLKGRLNGNKFGSNHNLILGLFLHWHDHEELAHNLAQDDLSNNGSLLHAIIHRREPDAFNAKYWFKKTGLHPIFPQLREKVAGIYPDAAKSEIIKLTKAASWDPFYFVDLCELQRKNPEIMDCLEQIQCLEMQLFLSHLLN